MPFTLTIDPPTLFELTDLDAWRLRAQRISDKLHQHNVCISSRGGLCYRSAECICAFNDSMLRDAQRAARDIVTCGLWVPQKTFSKRTSYAMKHELAEWRRIWTPGEHDYLSNDEFILAAIALGIPAKADVPNDCHPEREMLNVNWPNRGPTPQSARFALGEVQMRKKRKAAPLDFSLEAVQHRHKVESFLTLYGKNLYDFAPRAVVDFESQECAQRSAMLARALPEHICEQIKQDLEITIEFYKT